MNERKYNFGGAWSPKDFEGKKNGHSWTYGPQGALESHIRRPMHTMQLYVNEQVTFTKILQSLYGFFDIGHKQVSV